jgi:hypothetical protein
MRNKPTVGQVVFKWEQTRYQETPKWIEYVVTKVGRKYFSAKQNTPDSHFEEEFKLEDWRENVRYGTPAQMYASAQERSDELLMQRLCREIGEAFERGGNRVDVSLDNVKKIHGIVFPTISPYATQS